MALRLADSVVRVELDNTQRGRVTGELWLLGKLEPVVLALEGDCLKDLAGRHVVFTQAKPMPEPETVQAVAARQEGVVGDLTSSRKRKPAPVRAGEPEQQQRRKASAGGGSGVFVYLEWFSDQNGRVVIESECLRVASRSEAAWSMTDEESRSQKERNLDTMRAWMSWIAGPMRTPTFDDGGTDIEEFDDGDDEVPYGPMDEFEWERGLKESDALAERYAQARNKFKDNPDRDRLVAREMGWGWLEDAIDADERGAFKRHAEGEASASPEPSPLTEGIDWVRTASGHVTHPLSHRALEFAVGLWRRCKEQGLLGDKGDEDLHEMIFQVETLSVKIAGALDGLAYEEEPERGFVIACLKRALKFFQGAFAALGRVEAKNVLAAEELDAVRRELFAVREEMLRIMQRFRQQMR
jgi:hypothetical protein